jgi:hypothetical protein
LKYSEKLKTLKKVRDAMTARYGAMCIVRNPVGKSFEGLLDHKNIRNNKNSSLHEMNSVQHRMQFSRPHDWIARLKTLYMR